MLRRVGSLNARNAACGPTFIDWLAKLSLPTGVGHKGGRPNAGKAVLTLVGRRRELRE